MTADIQSWQLRSVFGLSYAPATVEKSLDKEAETSTERMAGEGCSRCLVLCWALELARACEISK